MPFSTKAQRWPTSELSAAEIAVLMTLTIPAGSQVKPTQRGGQYHAFLYDGAKMIDLGTLGGGYNAAYDINNSGLTMRRSKEYAFLYAGAKVNYLDNDYSLYFGHLFCGRVFSRA